MHIYVRPMVSEDICHVQLLEEAMFPTLGSKTDFDLELSKKSVVYFVAQPSICCKWALTFVKFNSISGNNNRLLLIMRQMYLMVCLIWSKSLDFVGLKHRCVVGCLGLQYIIDEVHITSFSVKSLYRGLGIGEALLIAAIEHAIAKSAMMITLEVRISNEIAIKLYNKYGFRNRGIRKDYYSDNKEDAIIMTNDEILSSDYRETLYNLSSAHGNHLG